MNTLFSQEHYELMAQFERQFKGERLDREAKDYWTKGYIYQDGHVNNLFLAFRRGVAYGTALNTSASNAGVTSLSTVKESLTDGVLRNSETVDGGM